MKNEIFVPYPFKVNKGDDITAEKQKQGQILFTNVKEFCEKSLKSKYEIDHTVYAKGVRVLIESNADVARLHKWLDN
jgi:hypothetical protein|tara:strand:+ start:172 stop:402 length:231 start_codon:yes stop_codon:yes gene_type:complete